MFRNISKQVASRFRPNELSTACPSRPPFTLTTMRRCSASIAVMEVLLYSTQPIPTIADDDPRVGLASSSLPLSSFLLESYGFTISLLVTSETNHAAHSID